MLYNDDVMTQKPLQFTQTPLARLTTYLQSGLRIAKASVTKEQPLIGSEQEIIKQIHEIRYNKKNPYVITGGHFSQLFVRNLGIFFNALLDPRIPTSETDWNMRQAIALKTLKVDLELFEQANQEYTTLAHVSGNSYTGLNLYARPSDSLHALVYTFNALLDDTFLEKTFPMKQLPKKQLQTKTAARKLLQKYKKNLQQLIENYYCEIIDPETGLVAKELLVSSARDGIKRQSSFYDNVIAWQTIRLAKKLDLYDISDAALTIWKKRIVKTFWLKKEGIFSDDLSNLSQKEKLFSADSFIVVSTGFLNVTKKTDRIYLTRMIQYVKKHKLDLPFPLHYATKDRPELLYRPVRHFAPSYMGTSIWSHWGMEYCKALLYAAIDDKTYLADAKKHLASYKKNIETYGGYPEVYDKNGKLLQTRLYRSVLHNGWVINYEQTKLLLSQHIVD